MNQAPLLAVNDTILWLKVLISAATIVLLYFRYRGGKAAAGASKPLSFQAKTIVVVAVLFSFATFHNFGEFRGGGFMHVGDMFHYYVGSKYFKELGYFDLYNAVIVADSEQANEMARAPFYTDLRTYQNAPITKALEDAARVRGLFSRERWSAFKHDIDYFKTATGSPHKPGLFFFLMDHGYNGSPLSTFILGAIANVVPVEHVPQLALLDVMLMLAMSVLVFRTFGFEMGALFSVYFCVNYLNPYDFISGCFLRYDWLFYIVVSVCLLERRSYASSAVFLTMAAMIRVFPAVLFFGLAVLILKSFKATRTLDKKHVRFVVAAGVTAIALFFLPAASLGSAVQPWKQFADNIALHDDGVYVNHLGLRGIVLFERSHLSLEGFVERFKSERTNDIVRNWQDIKEAELRRNKPVVLFAALLVLAAITAIIWKRESETESVLWPLIFVYAVSFPSHYYYAFLCLFVLLFFKRPNSLSALVPMCLLLALNIAMMVSDYFRPSPIVFYTLVNIYLFVCVASILGFELYASVLSKTLATAAPNAPRNEPRLAEKRRQRPNRTRRK